MANNKAVLGGGKKKIERRRAVLKARREKLGSYDKLAKELGVNVSYIYRFIKQGEVPVNKRIREAMGIDVVSRGAERYRALSEKARAKGWRSWSAYCRAVSSGEVEVIEYAHTKG